MIWKANFCFHGRKTGSAVIITMVRAMKRSNSQQVVPRTRVSAAIQGPAIGRYGPDKGPARHCFIPSSKVLRGQVSFQNL